MIDPSLYTIIELTYGDGWIDNEDLHIHCLRVDDCRMGTVMVFEEKQ